MIYHFYILFYFLFYFIFYIYFVLRIKPIILKSSGFVVVPYIINFINQIFISIHIFYGFGFSSVYEVNHSLKAQTLNNDVTFVTYNKIFYYWDSNNGKIFGDYRINLHNPLPTTVTVYCLGFQLWSYTLLAEYLCFRLHYLFL